MKPSGRTRTCPECGRTLSTYINRWSVEVWPQHKAAAYSDGSMSYDANKHLAYDDRDNQAACYNSAQPV